MIDRGFVKWQPFNSLVTPKGVLKSLNLKKEKIKPDLFPEEIAKLSETLLTAYYSKSRITIIYYENNLFKKINTTIKNINPPFNTLKFQNGKTISFNQIIKII